MNTEQLIRVLSQDRVVSAPPARRLMLELACGGAILVLVFAMTLGPRPDVVLALHSPRFVMKPLVAISLFIATTGLLLRLARPAVATGRWRHAPWLAPLALAVAVGVELFAQPASSWSSLAVGHNAPWCLTMIPLFAMLPLACALHGLRAAAPTRPVLAGGIAGLAAGALGAAVYALHCTDDSPLFVASWYIPAIVAVAAMGAALGRRLLRW